MGFIFDVRWGIDQPMEARKLALRCRELAENRKADNIVILDVRRLSTVTDFFLVASGTSEPHLRAIVDEITTRVREEYGLHSQAVDGTVQANWVVLDYFDVIVHIMRQDVRDRYDLEGLWGDAPRVRGPRARQGLSPLGATPPTRRRSRRR